MGRTVETAHQQLAADVAKLIGAGGFRNALRAEYRPALDRLLEFAHQEMAAISSAEHLLTFESAELAMLVRLAARVERLEILMEQALRAGNDNNQREGDDDNVSGLVIRHLPR